MSIGIETVILINDKATLQDTVTMEEADTENDNWYLIKKMLNKM